MPSVEIEMAIPVTTEAAPLLQVCGWAPPKLRRSLCDITVLLLIVVVAVLMAAAFAAYIRAAYWWNTPNPYVEYWEYKLIGLGYFSIGLLAVMGAKRYVGVVDRIWGESEPDNVF